jgi:A/G-specific adenine glycosylase
VIRLWQGLGYNRRALNLQRAAQALQARGRKPFPDTFEELIALPGVGRYTASAILSFSYNYDVSVVDVNIERVLSRLWKPMHDTHQTLPIPLINDLDAQILPRGNSSLWHQALMDHGSTICTKRKPKCEICPVLSECKSAKNMIRTRDNVVIRNSREAMIFGHPRRVWRGKILKLVAAEAEISQTQIKNALNKSQPSELTPLIDSILKDLVSEGFIVRHGRSKYRLI